MYDEAKLHIGIDGAAGLYFKAYFYAVSTAMWQFRLRLEYYDVVVGVVLELEEMLWVDRKRSRFCTIIRGLKCETYTLHTFDSLDHGLGSISHGVGSVNNRIFYSVERVGDPTKKATSIKAFPNGRAINARYIGAGKYKADGARSASIECQYILRRCVKGVFTWQHQWRQDWNRS